MKNCFRLFANLAAIGMMAACFASPQQQVQMPQTPTTQITNEDFARSDRFLLGKPETDVLNSDIVFQWIGDGDTFFYRSQGSKGTQYVLVDSATGNKSPLFDHQVMARALATALETTVDAQALPIEHLTRIHQNTYNVISGDKTLLCDLTVGSCTEQQPETEEPTATPSPDGKYTLFIHDYNLWLKHNENGDERALTTDGVRGWSYGRPPESSTKEITMRREGKQLPAAALWSPDGSRFISYRLDERHVPELALVQAIPEDGSFRPKLHTYHYDLVGEKPAQAKFFIYDVKSGARTELNYRALPSPLKVPLTMGHFWWSNNGSKLYMLDSPLSQPFMKLLEVNPKTGGVQLLLEESTDTTYFPSAFFIAPPSVKVLSNGDIVWFSERSDWGHLYLYDGTTGKLKNAITSGNWLVRDIQYIDEDTGYLYFSASGREPGEDIYYRHLYRVKLDGTGLELLTPEPGDHDFPAVNNPAVAAIDGTPATLLGTPRISPNGKYVVDHFSTESTPGRWLLRRNDGSLIAKLEDEDPSPLPPFTPPERFVVKSADGKYKLYGMLSKPANFDPAKTYPVIDHIYPGPQSTKAPKVFASGGMRGGAIFGDSQALADLGFVVIQVDGRGGTLRSKPFRDVSYRHMEKAGMLEDHISALRQLAKTRPWLDLDRVGIFGTSGGGFATGHALIDHPDVFKVGVASVGNHDQRSYLSVWGETYHGPANSTDYEKVFAGNNANRFKGKLLLAYGEMDDNVHPANTLRLADALIKANKQFDMLVMPNVNHGIAGTAYFRRITQNYFLKHLMGAQLPSESDIVLPGASQADANK